MPFMSPAAAAVLSASQSHSSASTSSSSASSPPPSLPSSQFMNAIQTNQSQYSPISIPPSRQTTLCILTNLLPEILSHLSTTEIQRLRSVSSHFNDAVPRSTYLSIVRSSRDPTTPPLSVTMVPDRMFLGLFPTSFSSEDGGRITFKPKLEVPAVGGPLENPDFKSSPFAKMRWDPFNDNINETNNNKNCYAGYLGPTESTTPSFRIDFCSWVQTEKVEWDLLVSVPDSIKPFFHHVCRPVRSMVFAISPIGTLVEAEECQNCECEGLIGCGPWKGPDADGRMLVDCVGDRGIVITYWIASVPVPEESSLDSAQTGNGSMDDDNQLQQQQPPAPAPTSSSSSSSSSKYPMNVVIGIQSITVTIDWLVSGLQPRKFRGVTPPVQIYGKRWANVLRYLEDYAKENYKTPSALEDLEDATAHGHFPAPSSSSSSALKSKQSNSNIQKDKETEQQQQQDHQQTRRQFYTENMTLRDFMNLQDPTDPRWLRYLISTSPINTPADKIHLSNTFQSILSTTSTTSSNLHPAINNTITMATRRRWLERELTIAGCTTQTMWMYGFCRTWIAGGKFNGAYEKGNEMVVLRRLIGAEESRGDVVPWGWMKHVVSGGSAGIWAADIQHAVAAQTSRNGNGGGGSGGAGAGVSSSGGLSWLVDWIGKTIGGSS
ncbi:hypothetical protein HDU76_001472 [Blyttiomyces sp. JEL0837]|nr:hypothetical protein HDU76_001472 [Blyttiomyces sp. JEL0837]